MTTAIDARAGNVAPVRRWGQFSLVSLLGLVVVGCVVAAYWGERRRREEAERKVAAKEAEIQQLRAALGIYDDGSDELNVTDLTRVHVKAKLPRQVTPDAIAWRWHIFVPREKPWTIEATFGEQWDEKTGRYSGGGTKCSFRGVDQLILDAELIRTPNGSAYLSVRTGRSTTAASVPENGFQMLVSDGKRIVAIAGATKLESFAATDSIQLLRWQVLADNVVNEVDADGRQDRPPSYGLSIRLKEGQ